jgi:hypothetical protein
LRHCEFRLLLRLAAHAVPKLNAISAWPAYDAQH